MWVIAKIKKNSLEILKKSMEEKLGDSIKFFQPKIKIQKFKKNKLISKEVDLIGDYIFCHSEKFENINTIGHLKNTKGLKYILNQYRQTQKEISDFVEKFKEFQKRKSSKNFNLYNLKINEHYKFCEGPFSQKIFKLIGIEKNLLKILIGKFSTDIKKDKYLVEPI